MGLQLFEITRPIMDIAQLSSSDGTTRTTMTNANVYAALVQSVLLSCDDPAVHVVQLFIVGGGHTVPIGSVSLPIGTGLNGTPAIDLLATGLPVLPGPFILPVGYSIQVSVAVALTTGHLQVVALSGLFT